MLDGVKCSFVLIALINTLGEAVCQAAKVGSNQMLAFQADGIEGLLMGIS